MMSPLAMARQMRSTKSVLFPLSVMVKKRQLTGSMKWSWVGRASSSAFSCRRLRAFLSKQISNKYPCANRSGADDRRCMRQPQPPLSVEPVEPIAAFPALPPPLTVALPPPLAIAPPAAKAPPAPLVVPPEPPVWAPASGPVPASTPGVAPTPDGFTSAAS